jgi:myo-inositol-1(or 4)-monophosphatase
MHFAKELALEAGRIAMNGFGKCRAISKGSGHDVLTEYDTRVENHLKERIYRICNEPILGEEEGLLGDAQDARRHVWIIDPIDGTLNYQRGIPLFGHMISFCRDGVPVVGVTYLPALSELFSARLGAGAELEPVGSSHAHALRVSPECDPNKMTVAISGIGSTDCLSAWTRCGRVHQALRQFFSAAVDGSYLAAGRLNMIVHTATTVWDFAVADILLREAGGPPISDHQRIPIFPEYLFRRLAGQTERFPIVAVARADMFDSVFLPLVRANG